MFVDANMGGCVSRSNRDPSANVTSSQHINNTAVNVTIGKNKPLSAEKPKWKSEIAMTKAQLKSKQDEFWETSPAYEGRKEIWDALKAACETDDVSLAQAIIDGANISLPTGSLTDAYDELGNHYVIPVYCVSMPTNIILKEEASHDSTESKESLANDENLGEDHMVRCRLSTTCKDRKMDVRMGETVNAVKKRLAKESEIGNVKQRWFYGGKQLHDKMTIADTRVPRGHVIQVILAVDNP